MSEQNKPVTEDAKDVELDAAIEEPAADVAEPEKNAEDGVAAQGESVDVEALQAELAETKDQALRAVAEAQNARRRADNEVEKARKFALEKFAADLLPTVDNLERAIANAEEEGGVSEGVQLTLKTLLDALARHQVQQVDPQGEPFDPQLHEAVAHVPMPDAEPNSVIDVMQKGYTLNGRLIRAAMVAVAKA